MKKQKGHDKQTTDQRALQTDEWKNKYLRALADYQNLEKQTREREKETRRFAEAALLQTLLPVFDNLRRVTEHVQDDGLRLVAKEMRHVLKNIGLEEIDVAGKAFDPHTMECVEVGRGEEGKVIEEVLPGYVFRGRVLRVAKVKVGKENIDEEAEELAKEELQKGDYM
jgi:molecular chaperone GrpE